MFQFHQQQRFVKQSLTYPHEKKKCKGITSGDWRPGHYLTMSNPSTGKVICSKGCTICTRFADEAPLVKMETFQSNSLQTSQYALCNEHVKQEPCVSPTAEPSKADEVPEGKPSCAEKTSCLVYLFCLLFLRRNYFFANLVELQMKRVHQSGLFMLTQHYFFYVSSTGCIWSISAL